MCRVRELSSVHYTFPQNILLFVFSLNYFAKKKIHSADEQYIDIFSSSFSSATINA